MHWQNKAVSEQVDLKEAAYSASEASKLIGIPVPTIRSWSLGRSYVRNNVRKAVGPVLPTRESNGDTTVRLIFDDLMELRFVRAFREFGISLQKLRRAADELRSLMQVDYPFSQLKIYTDGKRLFAESPKQTEVHKLYELSERKQFGFFEVIFPSLKEGVEFSGDRIVRWRPDKSAPDVVIDRKVGFGQPVIQDTGILTSVVADAFRAEGSIEEVARWLNIPAEAVQQAVNFEFRHAA